MAAQDRDKADYFVWVITGTEDFARTYDENRANLMRNSPYFAETADEQNGNFAFHLKQGYSHCILRWVRAGVPLWGEPVFR